MTMLHLWAVMMVIMTKKVSSKIIKIKRAPMSLLINPQIRVCKTFHPMIYSQEHPPQPRRNNNKSDLNKISSRDGVEGRIMIFRRLLTQICPSIRILSARIVTASSFGSTIRKSVLKRKLRPLGVICLCSSQAILSCRRIYSCEWASMRTLLQVAKSVKNLRKIRFSDTVIWYRFHLLYFHGSKKTSCTRKLSRSNFAI